MHPLTTQVKARSTAPTARVFVLSMLQCVAAGFLAALCITLVLSMLVLMLADVALAAGDDEQPLARPGDATHGTLLFASDLPGYAQAPLLHTEVDIRVTGLIARATVKQHFENPFEEWKEGIYVFPLPDRAAVDRLQMHIGQRVIEGQTKERTAARTAYRQAKAQGKRASLVEQERPNIFTTSLANIGPHESITVEITYQESLHYDNGTFRLRFPMVVAPRYIPGTVKIQGFKGSGWAFNTDQVPDAARITPPVLEPGGPHPKPLSQGERGLAPTERNAVTLQVALNPGFPLASVDSPSHAINVTQDGQRRTIRLAEGSVPANRDFELVWRPVTEHTPRAALFTEPLANQEHALLMLLPPTGDTVVALRRELILVIDTSGSMAGASIEQAKHALQTALGRLQAGDRFNIIRFASAAQQLFPSAVPATQDNLHSAQRFVHRLQANGGTEMAAALNLALQHAASPGLVRQVLFLTDGSVGNEHALFDIIHRRLGNTRLFTVGIGSAPNSHFMRGAARFGRGTFTYIGSVGEVSTKIGDLFTKLENPVLTDLKLSWPDSDDLEIWPAKIPDLYAGEPLLISARAPALPPKLKVRGLIAGSLWEASLELAGGQSEPGVGVLWARRKIEALTDSQHLGTELPAAEIRRRVTQTALDYHLVSKYTSLLAVDVTPARVREEILHSQALPVELPAGWDYARVFGQMPRTATNAQLHLLAAILLIFLSLFARGYWLRTARA